MKTLFAACLLALAGAAFSQDPGRASTPPGISQDGSRPAEGAIKGGSIQPGETSGLPQRSAIAKRCTELTGTLREQCLRDAESASGGATLPRPDPMVRDPRTAPPPQNPR